MISSWRKIQMLAFLLCLLSFGCSNSSGAESTLRKSGFSHIETDGHAFFACGDDDFSATKFTAVNPAGETVSGAVCCGLWSKGCTVRF